MCHIHTYIHTYMYIHTYIHTYIHDDTSFPCDGVEGGGTVQKKHNQSLGEHLHCKNS